MTNHNVPIPDPIMDIDFWKSLRQALLMLVDIIERKISIQPTTAQIRSWYKTQHSNKTE